MRPALVFILALCSTPIVSCNAILPTGHVELDPAPMDSGPTLLDIATPAGRSADESALVQRAYERYPWLGRLPNGQAIALRLARRVLLTREYERLWAKYEKMPSPGKTIDSYDIYIREKRREPIERKLGAMYAKMKSLDRPVRIDAHALLRDNFLRQRTQADVHRAMEIAGRRAVWDLLPRMGVTVSITLRPISAMERAEVESGRRPADPLTFALRVSIGGEYVRVTAKGLWLVTLLDNPYLWPAFNDIERAYWGAAVRAGNALLYQRADRDPSIVRAALLAFRERGYEYELVALPDDEQLVRDLEYEQRQRGLEMAERAKESLAPAAMVASLFVIDGAVDLVLTVVPVDKLGKLYSLGKRALSARKGSKKAAKLRKQFADSIDKDLDGFIRLASKLTKSQIRALKRIHEHTGSEAVIRALTKKQANGDADVRWIAKMLDRKRLRADTVRRFTFDADLVAELTLYKANPSWRVLQRVIEGKRVPSGQRDSLASKLKGLLGERAAVKHIWSDDFEAAVPQMSRAGLKIDRGTRYSKRGSLDLVMTNDDGQVVFGEVKNWSVKTWSSSSHRSKLFSQLDRHDAGIPAVLTDMSRRPSDTVAKVLIVAEGGFASLDARTLSSVRRAAARRGWTIVPAPMQDSSDLGRLIRDLR